MKKLIMILIILESALYCQNTGVPGKDFFPYMSFWDFAVYQSHPRQSSCTSSQYALEMELNDTKYYYPLLKSLGLTNIVSDFELIESLGMSNHYGNIKFLDMDFSWAGDDSPPFEPGRYLKATGNNPDFFAHQIGGTWDMSWNPDNKNFGFGTADLPSRWAMDPAKQPPGSPTITGDNQVMRLPQLMGVRSGMQNGVKIYQGVHFSMAQLMPDISLIGIFLISCLSLSGVIKKNWRKKLIPMLSFYGYM